MKISYNWLKEYISLDETPEVISEALTETGLEVEGLESVEKIKGGLKDLVVGEVKSCEQHPNADKLKVCKVDIGQEELADIVCGAPNIAAGQKVIVAPVNSTVHPVDGDSFKIKKAKIRGEVSCGMICAEDEIGLGKGHDGIMVLDTDEPNGTPAINLFDTGLDHVFEIGLTPNRGDATSHIGSARDLKAYFKRDIQWPEISSFDIKSDNPIEVVVENKTDCIRYAGVTIRGVKVAPSPDWLQWRLKAIGQEPINNIVDITNYVLHSLGQPLHAFDAAVVGSKLSVKNLPTDTKFTTLDDKERKLHEHDLMICNEEGGMCIAGVFGGADSGVKDGTTAIFLESACFSPDAVRATAQRHSLNTDASFRFERGTDPEICVCAMKYAAQLILEIAGGHIASDFVDIYDNPVKPVTINTKFNTFDRLIGVEIPHDRIIEILNLLDIKTEQITDSTFNAIVPSFRSEVTREADLVEEVLRIYGINNVEIDASFSTGYLAEFNEIEPYQLQTETSTMLSGKGFLEMLTNSLTNEQYETNLRLAKTDIVKMLNPSSEDLGIMKPSPLYTSLESIRFNLNRRQTNLKFYEFGKTYGKDEKGYIENSWLNLYLTGNINEESWMQEDTPSTFHHLSGYVRDVLTKAGIKYTLEPSQHEECQYGLQIIVNNKEIGHFGLINHTICDYFTIDRDVFFAQLDWNAICRLATKDAQYQPISKFPEVRRDLSLVLEKSISYNQISELAYNTERKLLKRMNVFSVFEGEQIGENKKSYAIAFYLQDQDKTLNEKQIDKIMSKMIHRFETELKAIIRK